MRGRQLSLPLKIGNRRVEPISIETKREFLTELAQTGNVKLASMRAGVSRSVAYHWRLTDPEIASAWDLALRVSMDGLREEVVETARTMGLGRWIELLDENGQPVLDDDFEKVVQYDVSHVDARVLIKLMDKAAICGRFGQDINHGAKRNARSCYAKADATDREAFDGC